MIVLAHVSELRGHLGRELGVSDWFTMTQERIVQFAAATGDDQWIHLDRERAGRESPYQTTIAHGFFSLALLSTLIRTVVSFGEQKLSVNYGLNRVRFVSAVPAGARVRARVTPISLDDVGGGASQVVWNVVVEREAAEKPCVVAEWIVRYYRT